MHLARKALEELLGRSLDAVDLKALVNAFSGRRILVTGAAGSIGAELCRQLLTLAPSHLACVDRNDAALLTLRRDLATDAASTVVSFHPVDILQKDEFPGLLRAFQPEIVFHVAAHKHVPLMESHVHRAVRNNVFGTLAVLDAAEEIGAQKAVLVSSDKAVDPVSIVGVTKRIGELLCAARPENSLQCISVRFGNVLGSSGSVIPIWQEQLRNGEPLTVTDALAERFFLPADQAVALLLHAGSFGQHRDGFVFDMGKPVRILDLAQAFLRYCGQSGQNIPIKFIGLRDGEKLKEELSFRQETLLPTPHPRIQRVSAPRTDWAALRRQLSELRDALDSETALQVKARLKCIVPEYTFPRLDGDASRDAGTALVEFSQKTAPLQ